MRTRPLFKNGDITIYIDFFLSNEVTEKLSNVPQIVSLKIYLRNRYSFEKVSKTQLKTLVEKVSVFFLLYRH